jgi:hypothetical protein
MVMFEDLDVPFSPGVAKLRTERINTKYLPGLKSDATGNPKPTVVITGCVEKPILPVEIADYFGMNSIFLFN